MPRVGGYGRAALLQPEEGVPAAAQHGGGQAFPSETCLMRHVLLLTLVASTSGGASSSAQGDLDLTLNLVPQETYPHAKCMDGTPPGYYFRPGTGTGAKSIIVFLEGGGWCYPSDVQQPCEPSSSHCSANCHIRANSTHGSSSAYTPTLPPGAIEGGTGYTSGNASRSPFAHFGVAYARYCDGGSFSGTMTTPDIALNGTPPLYYAGKFNLDAVLGDLVASHGVGVFQRVILSGCSAGGMACFIHCDYVANWFKDVNASIDVRCICDAGLFIDVPTVTGAGDVMRERFYDLADKMQTKPSLNPACVNGEPDWRECMFSETALKYTKTPLFTMNSMYNFGEVRSAVWPSSVLLLISCSANLCSVCVFGPFTTQWEMLAPMTSQSFPPDTTAPPADWASCWPSTGGLTAASYKTCNSTQKTIIAAHLKTFEAKLAPVMNPTSRHGSWLSACPSMHCQTGFAPGVLVHGLSVGDAAARWYFNRSTVKLMDGPFPSNPTCPKS